ncbi:MAG: aspartate/glutamate racemase family protein [Lachnospiraceae bacterium]
MQKNRKYGYLTTESFGEQIEMRKGQNIAGFPIGIIYIEDVYYPMLPGNVVNGYTYAYPVRLKAVKGLDVPDLFRMGESVYENIMVACRELEQEGVRAISSACGFFGNYHAKVAEQLTIPVALSSLVQLPWIAALLKPSQRIGVITADQSSFTEHLLDSCCVPESLKKRLVVKDARQTKEFSCVIEQRGSWDNTAAKEEIVKLGKEIVQEYPETGAILLECSDMPPYAYAVQEATQLPVFDFITLINWLENSVCQKPYSGFI